MKITYIHLLAMLGFMHISGSFAAASVDNILGYIPAKSSAIIFCSSSRFFPGSPANTLVENERKGGLETNFLITNTSETDVLNISKVDVFAMTSGALLTNLSPSSVVRTPAGFPPFKWVLAPHETTVLPQDLVLPPKQQSKPDLLWNNVVFTVKNTNNVPILAPMVFSDYVEYATPELGGGVLARIRADCVRQ